MDNILNLVYDKWDETGSPIPNGIKHESDNNDENFQYVLASRQISSFDVKCNNRKIEDALKYPDQKFYYIVWYRSSFTHRWFSELKLPITNEIVQLVKENKNLYLGFMNECESEPKNQIIFLDDTLKKLEINPNQVWVINNNSKLLEYKNDLNSDINVHTTRSMCVSIKYCPPINFKAIKNEGSFFMCHNRTPKNHRYALLCLLKRYKLLDDVDWSLINGWSYDNSSINYEMQNIFYDILPSEVRYFTSLEIYKSKYERKYKDFESRSNQNIFFEPETYENAYFNITTESIFSDNAVHITEKSFKPFFFFQYPLILATQHHIKYFKESYDLDFFDDIINHDYDNEKDNHDRIYKFIKEIKRIHDNKEFFIDFYIKNKDRFVKNHEKMRAMTTIHDYNFFNSLI